MKNIILTFTLFISLLSIGEILIYYYYDKENKKSERELDYIGNNITKTIQNEISISSSATFINELMLKANNYNTKEFENWALLILSNYKSISNIQLAPNGIVKKVYPLKGNEKAIGHNLLTDEKRRIAAIKAMESGKLTFIGPIKLIQNNKQAIIVRKPISKDGNFWGFSTVLISVNDMFEDIFKDLDHEAFNYTIYGYNPDASKLPLLKSSINQPSTNSKKYTIEVPNGSWYLYLEDKNKNLTKFVIFSILVLIISFMISFVSYKYLRNLDNENKKFKLLLKNAIDGIHIIDLKGNLVHASESFYKSLGYTYKEALKLHLTSYYKHLSKKQIKKLFKKVRKGEDLKLQTKLTRKDNSTFDAEVVARIITIDDYKYIYLSEKDITTKLRLESELKDINENLELRVKEATKKLNHSLEIINKYVINSKTDLEGNITEVTDRFCEVSKFKKEELIGKNHNITRHPDVPDSFFKELWETIKSGKTWYGIIQNRTKTGESYWVDTSISPLYDENNVHVGYFSHRFDVTEEIKNIYLQKSYNRELKQQVKEQLEIIRLKDIKMLEQAKLASLGEMIRNIAHQWRQPLNVISICSSGMEYLIEQDKYSKEELQKELKHIQSSCDYLTKTIDTFSKYLKNDKKFAINSIENEISSAKHISNTSLKSNAIKLIDNIDYSNNHKCYMVENELSQVILNILSNAEFALNENNKDKDKWIKISSQVKGNIFTIMIEDNAGGIPNDIIDKIFEPYFTTKFKSQGTGLGLSMSYSIIKDSIKGDIYVKNTSLGAKFFIELPLKFL